MYYTKYTGPESVSIVNALVAIGENSSYDNRKFIAAANGIADYSGTAAQNLQLLSLLKDGKLIKPGTEPTTDAVTKQGNIRKFVAGGLIIAAVVALGKMFFGENKPTKTATKKTTKKNTKKSKKNRKGLKGADDEMFELSSVDGERGCVTPLYDDADLYGDDYDRAEKWLRKELKADGLKIDKFWINEADGCWEFISKPNRK